MLEVMDQRFDRYARPNEDRRPAENVRVSVKDLFSVHNGLYRLFVRTQQ